jgi:WD40 repeat protein
MYNLKCTDGYQYTGSEAIYVLDLIPLGIGLAAIASDQSLCLFDPTRLSHGPTKRIQTSHGNLAVAKAYNAAESIVATTGENGSVSLWDLRLAPAQASVLQLAGELSRHVSVSDSHED